MEVQVNSRPLLILSGREDDLERSEGEHLRTTQQGKHRHNTNTLDVIQGNFPVENKYSSEHRTHRCYLSISKYSSVTLTLMHLLVLNSWHV